MLLVLSLVRCDIVKYLEEIGIIQHHNTSLWPRASEEVEQRNPISFKKGMQVL